MIRVNASKCTGCRLCEVACSLWHLQEVNPKRSRVRVATTWPWKDEVSLCRQCQALACVKACKYEALFATDGNVVVLNEEKCTKCMDCVTACPFNAVPVDAVSGFPLYCDTCNGQYQCVQWCPRRVFEVSQK